MLSNLNCRAKFGIELEFYIERKEKEYLFLSSVKDKIASLGFFCEKESSIHQYEIKSGCYTNSNNLIEHFELVKELITETAQKLGGNASIKAKPFLDRAGSALNVHVNLVYSNNSSLFYSR
nr:hypothetical protein [Wolbachia endosymbiont of Atemnus politus]